MKPQLVILHGNTGTGKTAGSEILQEYGYVEVHPFGFTKRFLEDLYECPNLDTQEGKKYSPPGVPWTMQLLMVDMFSYWAKTDPYYTSRKLRQTLIDHFERGVSVCLVSLRNHAEIDSVIDVVDAMGISSLCVQLEREGQDGVISDRNMQDLFDKLVESGMKSVKISNNGTLDDLSRNLLLLTEGDRLTSEWLGLTRDPPAF
jgi:hypothetical protein